MALACVLGTLNLAAAEPSSSTHAKQTGTIFGTLVNRSVPVRDAIVSIPKLWLSEQTAEDGTFRLTNVTAGTQVLHVHYLHGRDFNMVVTVAPGREDTVVVSVPLSLPPCPHPTPDCTSTDRRQHQRIGKPCELHPWVALVADTVPVTYGGEMSALTKARRDSFPNALTEWREGPLTVGSMPVLGLDHPVSPQWASGRTTLGFDRSWMEVAYCGECRAAYLRYKKR